VEEALDPGLYVVATPIGHASDITLRALRVLGGVDAIACEDTRVTAKLLAIHGISTSLTPYHDHNARTAGPALVKRLADGGRIALVSDAGTPLVSDPGYRLVRACADAGVAVIPIPGPSAVLAALCVSGLPTDRFLFAGFAPPRTGPRRRFLAELATVPATLVLMESPRRLAAALADMAEILGPRQAVVARELTKLFEEVRRGALAELADHYREAAPPRGEVTLVVSPPAAPPQADDAEVDRLLSAALDEASVRDAAEQVAAETGLAKRHLYARALELRRRRR
jgi:16S rRNA (cytidine1402-2'-O)-methyltransferase